MLRTRIVAGATALTIAIGSIGALATPASADGRPGFQGGQQHHGGLKKPKNNKPKGHKQPDRGAAHGGGGPKHAGGGHGPRGGWGQPPGWGPGPGWVDPGYHPPRPPRPPKAPWKVRPGPKRQVCVPRYETVSRWNPYHGWVTRQVYVGQTCGWQPVHPPHRRHPRHRW